MLMFWLVGRLVHLQLQVNQLSQVCIVIFQYFTTMCAVNLQFRSIILAVSDEEQEVPSRNLIKRQALLMVDSKSRRKGYRAPAKRK